MDDEKSIPKIRTYESDTEIFMKDKKISSLDISTKAYMGRAREGFGETKKTFGIKSIVIIIFVVIALGTGIYFFLKYFSSNSTPQPIITPQQSFKPYIAVESQKAITFQKTNPASLTEAIKNELDKNLVPDAIVYLDTSLTSREFINFTEWNPPKSFLENIEPNFNILGVDVSGSQGIALIFKIQNFEAGLSSMLEWEPSMWREDRKSVV